MEACLIVEHTDGRPETVPLAGDGKITLGRSRKNTIVLRDKHASREHAAISCRDGNWWLRDCGTLNGTFLDGQRLDRETILRPGQVIGISETRLRFQVSGDAGEHESTAVLVPAGNESRPFARISEGNEQDLAGDEVSAIVRFMSQSLDESSHLELVRRALTTVMEQVSASAVGFLSFDPDWPVPRLVVPETGGFDCHLSKELTRKVAESARTVWVGERHEDANLPDSVGSYSDAVCVPLGTQGAPEGALHVYTDGKHFTRQQVRFVEVVAGCLTRSLKQLHAQRSLRAENQRLRSGPHVDDRLMGASPVMQCLFERIERLARSQCRVILISGESGSGKELVAGELHRRSARVEKPFVAVNCASLPRDLADAHLFGHERGAFTGAGEARAGYFREADDGTLFLDEIGELSAECQAKLLRVIEGKGFRPLSARADAFVDVRIVAATNRDLAELVRQEKFRADLLYRLEISLAVPPLRERGDDIIELARYFSAQIADELGRHVALTDAALKRLKSFPWPGNVRQLRSILRDTITCCDKEAIDADDIDLSSDGAPDASRPHSLKLDDVESWAIRKVLRQTAGNQGRAAEILGINRDTLRLKMKKLGIGKEG